MSKRSFFKILIIFLGLSTLIYWLLGVTKRKIFLSNLKGEIVYTCRDGNISNIYKISASGKNKRLLFHNEDKINSNSFLPMWAEDGSKIYFTAMKGGEWKRFSMEADGSNAVVLEDEEPLLTTHASRSEEIGVKMGNLYYITENNKHSQIYHSRFYDFNYRVLGPEFAGGPKEASWSPDKNFIIFENADRILVANKEGTMVVEVTKGGEPDWKY